MTGSADHLACANLSVWCSNVSGTAGSSCAACPFGLLRQITMNLRGKQVHVAAAPKCVALKLTSNAMPGDRRDQTATPKTMCLVHWLVLKGNLPSSEGKLRGGILL